MNTWKIKFKKKNFPDPFPPAISQFLYLPPICIPSRTSQKEAFMPILFSTIPGESSTPSPWLPPSAIPLQLPCQGTHMTFSCPALSFLPLTHLALLATLLETLLALWHHSLWVSSYFPGFSSPASFWVLAFPRSLLSPSSPLVILPRSTELNIKYYPYADGSQICTPSLALFSVLQMPISHCLLDPSTSLPPGHFVLTSQAGSFICPANLCLCPTTIYLTDILALSLSELSLPSLYLQNISGILLSISVSQLLPFPAWFLAVASHVAASAALVSSPDSSVCGLQVRIRSFPCLKHLDGFSMFWE